MDYKPKQPLLWLGAVLLALPVVHAAGLSTITQPLVDLFGPRGFYDIYSEQTSLLWDSILAAVIFIGLSLFVFGKRFGEGKMLPVTMGLVLAIGFVVFEANTGFRLGRNLAIPAFFVLYGFFIFIIYALLNRMISNKALCFMIAFVFMYMFIPDLVHQRIQENSNVAALLDLLFIIAIIGVLVAIFALLFKKFTGKSITGGSSGSGGSGDAAKLAKEALEEDAKITKKAEKEEEKKRKREAAKAAADAAKADLEITVPQLEQATTNATKASEQLEELVTAVHGYAQTVNDRVQDGLKQGMDMGAYRSQVAGYQAQLDPYFNAMQQKVREMQTTHEDAINVAKTLDKTGDDKHTMQASPSREVGSRDRNFLFRFINKDVARFTATSPFIGVKGQLRKLVEYFEIRIQEADERTDALKYIYKHEARLELAFKRLLAEYQLAAESGADMKEADEVLRSAKEIYEQHRAILQQVRSEHEALLKVVQPLREKANNLIKAIEGAEAASKETPKLLGTISEDIIKYKSSVYNFMGNPKKWNSFFGSPRSIGEDLLKTIRTLISTEKKKTELLEYINGRMQELAILETKNAPAIDAFAEKVKTVTENEVYFIADVLSAEIQLRATGLCAYATPSKITVIMSEKMMGQKEAYPVKPNTTVDAYMAMTPAAQKVVGLDFIKRIKDHTDKLYENLADSINKTGPAAARRPYEILDKSKATVVSLLTKARKAWP